MCLLELEPFCVLKTITEFECWPRQIDSWNARYYDGRPKELNFWWIHLACKFVELVCIQMVLNANIFVMHISLDLPDVRCLQEMVLPARDRNIKKSNRIVHRRGNTSNGNNEYMNS